MQRNQMIQENKWPRQKYKYWFPLDCLYFYHPTSQLVFKLEVGLGWVKGLRQAKCPKNYTNKSVILYKKKVLVI